MTISGKARLAGVIGDPISHSLSPRLHAHWLEAYGVDGFYVPLKVARESFAVALRGLRLAGFAGLNVTVPHKEAAFALAARVDDAARAARAVNLLIFRDNHVEGRNTDSAGLSASLIEHLGADALRGKTATLVGAGGAARAAIVALDALGAKDIRVVARNNARGDILARDMKTAVKAQLQSFALEDWNKAASDVSLLVNTTSAGMRGNPPLALPLDPLPRDAAVCDIVYNPLETPLLTVARARGHSTIDGLGMLMHQAVPAFEAFYGVKPQVTPALRRLLEGALHGGQ
ncbi:MAG TPA: shikimate dehydrogenase [Rhizomicrobium sp.]|nr:shikimate dehydrogenase [Rhizomicrobium sp.]